MPRNRYTRIVHDQDRMQMVHHEKQLTALVRELRSGVAESVDPLLAPTGSKARRETRRMQKRRQNAEQPGRSGSAIPDTASSATAVANRGLRHSSQPRNPLTGRSPS